MRQRKTARPLAERTPRPPLEPIVTPPSEEFKTALYAEIQRMEQARRDVRRIPEHILYVDLLSHISAALNALYKDGKIKVGQTVNDKHITTQSERQCQE